MAKRMRLWALLTAALLLLCGCVPRQAGISPEDIALPEPSEEPANMFLGEKLPSVPVNVSLYYAMSDGASFSTVSLGLRPGPGETLIEAAVNALLNPSGSEAMYFSTGDTRLLSCEYACGIATVNLSLDAQNVQSEQELLSLVTAIGNTLLGIEGVRGVNVLIGNQSQSFGRLPSGIQTEIVPSVTAAYAQTQAERDHLLNQGSMPVTRTATLYFPTVEGRWLVPELRQVTFTSDDFALALIDALKAGPEEERCAVASIPAGVELMARDSGVQTLSTGERVLTLSFSANLSNYLAFSGLETWELAGSIALTVCSFLPELDGVRILVGGEPIAGCAIDGATLTFEDGLIRRADFANRVGSVATLVLSAGDGTLSPLRRAVSMRTALSPRSLLCELLDFRGDGDGLSFPAPEEVTASDILGIQISGQVARVNLSGNFYRCCQPMNADDERAIVYCIVNTLCEMDGIRAVRFYVEGVSADTLSGGICLTQPLMPNPGIVTAQAVTGEP